jgi:hypothetical protein
MEVDYMKLSKALQEDIESNSFFQGSMLTN